MTLPGSTVVSRDTPVPRSAPTNTGVWFLAGLTERGPTTAPALITSMTQFRALYGERVSYGIVYDALDVFFREGGGQAYIARVVGPAAVKASINLFDQSGSVNPGDIALIATAKNAGDWWNNVQVTVTQPGGAGAAAAFVIAVSHTTLGVLETSPSLLTRADAVTWASTLSSYLDIALGTSAENPRAAAATSLTAGTDDRASITDTHWDTALALFAKDLGPGQVSFPGRTTAAAHTSLLTHAGNNNRVAILDATDTATVATLTAAVATDRVNNPVNVKYGAVFGPWAIAPGVTPGTTRTVPYSAVQAGLIARSDGKGNSANVAAAGSNGEARYITGLSQVAWTDAQREVLNDGGFNVARLVYGTYRTYGYRSMVSPTGDTTWLQFSNVRLEMQIKALAAKVLEEFNFDEIDGQGNKFGELNGAISGELIPLWQGGSLYGATASEAFYVDTGDQVNTPTTIAAGYINAEISCRMSPFGERTVIGVSKVPITQEL